jgi:hypothetical protein
MIQPQNCWLQGLDNLYGFFATALPGRPCLCGAPFLKLRRSYLLCGKLARTLTQGLQGKQQAF